MKHGERKAKSAPRATCYQGHFWLLLLLIFPLLAQAVAPPPIITTVTVKPFYLDNEMPHFTVEAFNDAEIPIDQIEFSIDFNPGPGAGTIVAVPQPANPVMVSVVYDGPELSPGIHLIFIYARDQFGVYSNVSVHQLNIQATLDEDPLLVMYEYAYDVDPGIGLATQVLLGVPINPLEAELILDLPGELPLGTHTVYIRFQDEHGSWGTTYYHEFEKLPDIDPSLVDFNGDFQIDIQDLLIFMMNFPCAEDCVTDVDQDGDVDVNDLLQFFIFFGLVY